MSSPRPGKPGNPKNPVGPVKPFMKVPPLPHGDPRIAPPLVVDPKIPSRNKPGIVGPGGKSVNKIYNTY